MLRSCYSSQWRLFKNSSNLTTGYFYFCKEGTPFYPGQTWLWSREWISDENNPPAPLGESMDAVHSYYKGSPPGGLQPDTVFLGSPECFSGGDTYPASTTKTLVSGVNSLCWLLGAPTNVITVETLNGSAIIPDCRTLKIDTSFGLTLSQTALNDGLLSQVNFVPEANLTTVGTVNLSPQSLGAGAKYFSDKVGVGTTSPLANSALDVRGYTYSYFAGPISFGGGNSPSAETDGAILQYDKSVGNKNISLNTDATAYVSNTVGGWILMGTAKRFALRIKGISNLPKFGFFDDNTGLFTDGVTGTGGGGDTITGGLVTGLGSARVSSVTASAPLSSSGGSTPNISLSGVMTIGQGGTNSGTALNNNRIMLSASGKITEAGALADGQLLIGATGGAPSAAGLTANAGDGVVVTNAANSIRIQSAGAAGQVTPYSGASVSGNGTTQGGATPIVTDVANANTSSAGNNAYVLPASPGFARIMINTQGSTFGSSIFPPGGGKINGLAVNAALSLVINTQTELWSTDAGNLQWWSR